MNINEVISTTINQGEHREIPITKKLLGVSNFIKKNCSEILEIYKETNKLLYRGFNDKMPPIFIGNPRRDRWTKDTPQMYQTAIDNKLRDEGFKALRNNSIFCTSKVTRAMQYGIVYTIFPTNGFNYTWSSSIYDMYAETGKDEFTDDVLGEELSAYEFIKKYQFKDDNLINALVSTNEIYINGTYVGINSYNPIIKTILGLEI